MILSFRKIIFIYFFLKLKRNKNLSYENLNFRRIDFTNYHQIKSFIFKKNFYKIKNKNIHSFDFLNFSKKLGGKIGINLSKEAIFGWNRLNKNKLEYPWSEDLSSKRLINLIYNYEYIKSSSKLSDKKRLDLIIFCHLNRIVFDFNFKKIYEITSYDLLGFILSGLILNRVNEKQINYIKFIVQRQIDKLGIHKSYNILEHSKCLNNLIQMDLLLTLKIIEELSQLRKF